MNATGTRPPFINIYSPYYNSKKYTYYTTPDGQDLFKKLGYTVKNFGGIGLCLGVMRAFGRSKRFVELPMETLRIAFPWAAGAALYTLTTYSATKMRGKDDMINAGIGGGAAAILLASWVKEPFLKGSLVIGLITICMLKKSLVESGIPFPPPPMAQLVSSAWGLRSMDMSMAPEERGINSV